MRIEVRRTTVGKNGIGGELYVDDIKICNTLELPYKDNQTDLSSIKAGGPYQAFIKITDGEERITFNDAHGRTGIQFHRGNWTVDRPDSDFFWLHKGPESKGCFLVGAGEPDVVKGYISNSKVAFNKLMKKIHIENIQIKVYDPPRGQVPYGSFHVFEKNLNIDRSLRQALDFDKTTGGRLKPPSLKYP